MNDYHDIIETVRLTEKATLLGEQHNQYVFRVARKANKVQIKRAVEALFNKTVLRVNTMNYLGKARRQRTAAYGDQRALRLARSGRRWSVRT